MNGRRLVAVSILAAAVWVNYPYVVAWFGGGADAPQFEPAEAPVEEDVVPPAPGLEAPIVFAPVVPVDDLVDPFQREDLAAAPVADVHVQEILPRVTLILLTGGSRRAVVDGRTVGVGDRLALGTVAAIEAGTVTVATAEGNRIKLTLPAPGKRKVPRKPTVGSEVDLPEIPEEKR
ncbi:MAG: hypothetical protein R3F56_16440 [Planctomycetota bacterium]